MEATVIVTLFSPASPDAGETLIQLSAREFPMEAVHAAVAVKLIENVPPADSTSGCLSVPSESVILAATGSGGTGSSNSFSESEHDAAKSNSNQDMIPCNLYI